MFLGEYQHTVDDKGRIAVPVKFRSSLQKGAVVTRGIDQCLFVYPIKEWESLAAKLASLPVSQANTRAFARLMLAGAMEVKPDRQGRVILPDYLRKYAGLRHKVVLAGLYNRLELWDSERWESYRKGTEENSAVIAEAMHDLGV
ncbi:MAG: division/cell wall cluster transcriptional repressor MraZ [Patescibacteria group bacterium]|jgi:MraZ protein